MDELVSYGAQESTITLLDDNKIDITARVLGSQKMYDKTMQVNRLVLKFWRGDSGIERVYVNAITGHSYRHGNLVNDRDFSGLSYTIGYVDATGYHPTGIEKGGARCANTNTKHLFEQRQQMIDAATKMLADN